MVGRGVIAPCRHESSLAGDPGFDYLLGIAALDSGHLTHRVFVLERVLAVQPDQCLRVPRSPESISCWVS